MFALSYAGDSLEHPLVVLHLYGEVEVLVVLVDGRAPSYDALLEDTVDLLVGHGQETGPI